jgi:hypothetical protein
MAVKRVNYFTHQFLREQDFKDEQKYHIEALQRHNQHMHPWGVVSGLEVEQQGEHEIVVQPGYAIDKEGREIWLDDKITRNMRTLGHHDTEKFVTVTHHSEPDEAERQSAGGVDGVTRLREVPQVHEHDAHPGEDHGVLLAGVRLGTHGRIEGIEMSSGKRRLATQPSSATHGWLRFPFKPVQHSVVKISGAGGPSWSPDHGFIIEEAYAHCESRGARGSMQIPVPPGNRHITGFRIAGTTHNQVLVGLHRGGINVAQRTRENSPLFELVCQQGVFDKEVDLNATIDEWHTLSVSIRATGESEIWMLGVRFH